MSENSEQPNDLESTILAQEFPASAARLEISEFPLPEDLSALLPAGAYQVENVLGRGGMGTVYKGIQLSLKRPVAIKIMRRNQGQDYNFAQRFQREALAMAELNHPNIVSVFDYGEAGTEYLFIVMEFVDGSDLMNIIRAGTMTQEMALSLIPQICDALQFAHDHGIVHRDIKPSNIMLTRHGRIKMADFGLAKRSDLEDTFVTRTGVSMGTPDYAAPEQFDASMAIDHRADIYALGVMMYQMLTGHLPRGAWRPPSQRAKVAQQWDEIINHAIQADPKDRYQAASEIKTDISTMISLAEKDKDEHPTGKVSSIRSRGMTLALASALAIIGGFLYLVFWKSADSSNTDSHKASKAPASELLKGGYNVLKIGARPTDLQKTNSSKVVHDVAWKDGVLVMGGTTGKGQIFDYRSQARDAILRAEVRFDPATSSPQLCLRNQNGENHGKFYRLWMDIADSNIKLAFVEKFQTSLLQQWKRQPSQRNDEWLSMELRTIANQITVVVDGQLLGTFTHEGIPQAGGYQIFSNGLSQFRNVEYINLDPPPTPSSATKELMYVNSLGMKFVPAPIIGGATNGKRLLFSIWETRERDYEAFILSTKNKWFKDKDIDHGPDHPVTNVAWEGAQSFCQWLTDRERSMGKLQAHENYRLPSDHEWSCAVGIGAMEDPNALPSEKCNRLINHYPWGSNWPPPHNTGNFWSEELRPLLEAGKFPWVKGRELTSYRDGYATLAPVGSFAPNSYGLHDLAGNAAEWCQDWFDQNQTQRVVRGSEWCFVYESVKSTLLSSYRTGIAPETRQIANGFRVVLEVGGN